MPVKSINFESTNDEDMKLYEWLRHRGYGVFTAGTKSYWKAKMMEEQSRSLGIKATIGTKETLK